MDAKNVTHAKTDYQSLTASAVQWPIPMAGTPAQNENSAAGNSDFSRRAEELAAGLWMTPRATTVEYTRDGGQKGAERLTLEGEATTWPTPATRDHHAQGATHNVASQSDSLSTIVEKKWPTPAARDHKGENSPDHLSNGTGRLHMDQLPNAVAFLFSHSAPATAQHGPTLSQLRPIWHPLRASVIASHGRATWRRLVKGRNKRRLNPSFVEWLMGWPIGHALCDCSGTEWCRFQRRMRSALSRLPMASGPWIWKPPIDKPEREQMGFDL